MRELTATEESKLHFFESLNIPFALFETTSTGLEKSIFDATKPVRDLLTRLQLHDYEKQEFGGDKGIAIPTTILLEQTVLHANTRFYRAETRGDRRMSFENVKDYASSGDILLLFGRRGELYLINLTKSRLNELANSSDAKPVKDVLNQYKTGFKESNTVLSIESPVFKLSHGKLFSYDTIQEFRKRKIAVINEDTAAKGRNKFTQAEDFKHAQIGDYFYLCNASFAIYCIAKFTSNYEPCDVEGYKEQGWIQRKYEIVYEPIQIKPYIGSSGRWWSPKHYSTFTKIPEDQMAEANSYIFRPHFDVRIELIPLEENESEFLSRKFKENEVLAHFESRDDQSIEKVYISGYYKDNLSFLRRLRNLKELTIANTGFKNLGIVRDLLNLIRLEVPKNNISDISAIRALNELAHLDLRNNNLNNLDDLPLEYLRGLASLKLSGNPELKLPLSDFDDLNGIIGYKQSLEEGALVKNRHVKVNIIGSERIGKSQLFNVLQGKPFLENEPPTHGTQTGIYNSKGGYTALLWDFGGQSYHHGTHKIFLRPNDIYLILWRNDGGNYSYSYWLGTARKFGENSPQLLVQNTWQGDKILFPDSRKADYYKLAVRDTFAFDVAHFLNINSDWELDINYFKGRLEQLIKKHANRFEKLSKKNVNIRKRLDDDETTSDIYWKLEDFRKQYASSFNEDQFAYLLNYLEYSGRILYFREQEELNQYVFTNPPDLSRWIYQEVLHNSDNNKEASFVKFENLEKDLGSEKAKLFITLMKQFGLIFRNPFEKKKVEFIVPQFLPENNSATKSVLLELLPYTFCIRYEDFIHEGAVFNFISEYGEYSLDISSIWKYGIIFKHEKFQKQVLMHFEKESQTIYFHIEKNYSQNLIAQEMYDYFLKEHSDGIQGIIDVEENVCISTDNDYFFNILQTKKNIEEDVFYGECTKSSRKRKLNILEMSLLQREKRMKKVFISYSRKDVDFKDALRTHLSPLVRYGVVQEWACEDMVAGKWDDQIQNYLEEADIIVYMVSANFMASDYIMEKEVKKGLELVENDPKKKIMGVLVRECLWRQWTVLEKNLADNPKSTLSDYQMLPYHKKNGEEALLALEAWGNGGNLPLSNALMLIAERIMEEAK